VFEHFYQQSVFSDQASTHYINAAHVLHINQNELSLLPISEQHDGYQWHTDDYITNSPDLHKYTKGGGNK